VENDLQLRGSYESSPPYREHTRDRVGTYVRVRKCVRVCTSVCGVRVRKSTSAEVCRCMGERVRKYGVASISRLLKITGLFYKRDI